MQNSAQALPGLCRELQGGLGLNIVNHTRISGGMNSQLYRLIDDRNLSFLGKFYFDDERRRREREYKFLSLLGRRDFTEVPRPIFQSISLNCGVYEWIEGEKKVAEAYTEHDVVELADFITKLHRLDHRLDKDLPEAFMAVFSLKDVKKNIEDRIAWVHDEIVQRNFSPDVLAFFDQEHPIERVKEALQNICVELGEERINAELSDKDRRISSIDFGPHNTLFRPDGRSVFIDFEYAGVDHPLRAIVDYINHEKTVAISPALKQIFLKRYFEQADLSEEMKASFEPMRRLGLIEWHLVHINSLRSAKIKQLQFSHEIGTFDQDGYIQNQLLKATKSLKAMEEG